MNLQLQKNISSRRELELKKELRKLDEFVAELKGDMMDKETTLQNIFEENETMKLEISKGFPHGGNKVGEEVVAELEVAKPAEREAVIGWIDHCCCGF